MTTTTKLRPVSWATAALLAVNGCATAPPQPAAPAKGSAAAQEVDAPAGPAQAATPPRPPAGAASAPVTRAELYTGTGRFIADEAAPAPAGVSGPGEYTLNFKGTDLQEVVKAILGDILGLNYTIDEKVKGQVTLQTSKPVARDALIPTLEALLRTQGAVLVQAEGLYKIVPQAAALAGAASPNVRLLGEKGYQVLVVPLRYIAAREMEKILKPLQAASAVVQLDGHRNLMILAGTQAELGQMLKTIEIFDVDQLEGMSVGLFRLSAVDAGTLAGELNEIFGDGPEGAAGMIRFIPIDRLNALLVITPQQKYLQDAQVWIERLDRVEEAAATGLHVYYVQNGRAAHLAELLGQLFGTAPAGADATGLPRLAPGARPAVIQSELAAAMRRPGADLPAAAPPASAAEPAKRIVAKRTEDTHAHRRPSEGDLEVGAISIIADEANNALLVRATAADYAKVEQAIRKLDTWPLQVLVEATIVDVELTDALSLGVEWFLRGQHGDKRTSAILDLGDPGLAALAPGFSYTLIDSANAVRGVLNTLASESRLKVVSSPSMMVLDNHKATIRVGDQVPIRTSEAASIATTGDTPIIASTIEYRDTGVLLEVTPRVNASGMVVMDIRQEFNDVQVTTSSGIDSPTINQRRINTTVAVSSGETIILGGLIRDRKSRAQSGVPGLRRIPLLGWLFASQDDVAERSELIVVITPTAIKDQGEARAVTDEIRERMKNLAFPDWLGKSDKKGP